MVSLNLTSIGNNNFRWSIKAPQCSTQPLMMICELGVRKQKLASIGFLVYYIILPHEEFGIDITSLLLNYINSIGQQLIQALNDPGQLGIIYQGLAKFISAKYGGSLHLPKLKRQACTKSPITITLFLLQREYEIHTTMANQAVPIKQTPLEKL